jgi:isoquinoline 1-oxidoreductase beta subunit
MHVLRHLDRAGRERLAAAFAAPAASAGDRPAGLSRRALLQGVGGLVVVVGWGAHDAVRAAAPGAIGADAAATGPLAPNDFVRVGTDGVVTVVCKHHEMGQGNTTGLASMVAEELDADWALVRTEYAPSDPKRYANLMFGDLQGTGGSSAISNSFLQYRNAGATARGDARGRRGRGVEGAGERDPHGEGNPHACLGQARGLRRIGRRGEPRQAQRRPRR